MLKKIRERKLVAIFRGIDPERCSEAANALYDGGISLCEVTFRMEESPENFSSTTEGIKRIKEGAGNRDIHVGAGTVLTLEQVALAYDAGAEFIITPGTNVEVIRMANALKMVTMPGAFSPSEAESAYEAGADFVKIFPASVLGSGYFKALSGPLAHIPLIGVGGIDENNMGEFLKAGAAGFGIGGNLVSKKLIDAGKYDELRELAEKYVSAIK
ncbi:MAG: bifunctional 4-hydroxy-2-oxoglutarate aldolase/2-dehydro-3-deoxy-phosphogluconate aldolase [Lachnospiraceae bacterium]|nr:bifunctional 4-hydroxy-2-oxoglutarate aldolase/2-dehydro-3-deoxy-phosphogluconate aldolase [Lachnospiraceae bacterium]